MSTCNRCGSPVPQGQANCQHCGMPLPTAMNSGAGPEMVAPEQPELPAWLETLRAGERATPSPAGSTNFSPDDILDEGTLPSWMRLDGIESSNSSQHPAIRPAGMAAPNTDGGLGSPSGMPARSLIDEQSLPSWLHEPSSSSTSAPGTAQDSITGGSLVQPEAVPNWMKTVQPPPAPNPLHYAQPVLPPQGLVGKDFIDEPSLPSWMSNENGQNIAEQADGQAGLAGSSLLDMQDLPPWLREAAQQEPKRSTNSHAYPVEREQLREIEQYAQPFPSAPPEQQTTQAGQPPNMNSNLIAASLIDMEALPDWLRPPENSQPSGASALPQQGVAENLRPGSFNVPPRVENVPVPGRPRRGERGTREESEVAANVFASMLGVASAAPTMPGQQSGDASGRFQQGEPPQPQQNMPQMGNAMPSPPPRFTAPPQGFAGPPPAQDRVATGGLPPQQHPSNRSGGQAVNDQPKQPTKKRGFFEALRDLFFRN